MKRVVSDLMELNVLAHDIQSQFKEYPVAIFIGDMGSGKTTFIKLICEKLGVTDNMSSPTFSIVNEYRDENNAPIYHFDLYRLNDLREAMDIGIEEYIYSGNKCFIEWPDLIKEELPERYLEFNIKLVEENKREITISHHD